MAISLRSITHKLLLLDTRIDARTYLAAGTGLFVVKLVLDHTLAARVFGRSWSWLNYLVPSQTYSLPSLPPEEQRFYGVMLLVATPFILIGLLLTSRRLKDIGLPRWLIILFFVPTANLIFFSVLGVTPGAKRVAEDAEPDETQPVESLVSPVQNLEPRSAAPLLGYGTDAVPDANRWLARLLPSDPIPSALVAVFAPVPVALVMLGLGVTVFRNYGWGLFVGLPFMIGMISAVLHGAGARRTLGQSLGVACLSLLVCGAAMLVFGLEGLGCLIMCAPVTGALAAAGAAFGHAVINTASPPRAASWALALLSLPLFMGAEALVSEPRSTFAVTTSVEVDAPPDRVWDHVTSFPDLPAPDDWFFKTGVAYPIRARIEGSGPGAVRYCEFSTGNFVEPIEEWQPGRLLKFSVSQNPPPMREWSLYRIRPPHLENFLISHGGQFRLVELPSGRTRLEGTTWYEHGMWPETYWRWWSDAIIHRIHQRVLNHVKRLSEES